MHFIEVSPGYMIPIRLIHGIQWKEEKLRIAYEKGDGVTTVTIDNKRGAAEYLYQELRELAITYETGPNFDIEE